MLPDQDPPTDFVFAKGTFALDDAAVAAGAAADAAGVSADALEQQRGEPDPGFSEFCRGAGAIQARL